MTLPDSLAAVGFSSRFNWLIGGAVSGIVGSLLFGAFLWTIDPEIVAEIPAYYGLPTGTIGWPFHLFHGLILGVIFGFLVTRDIVLGTISARVETGFIATMGTAVRLALAGLIYGLAIWAILPIVILPVVASAAGVADPFFPGIAFESLIGHLVYGLVLGALFSVFVDIAPDEEQADAPFEEPTDST